MVEGKLNKFSLAIGIVGFFGSLLTIIGFVIPYSFLPNIDGHPGLYFLKEIFLVDGVYLVSTDLSMSIILALVILILIFSLMLIISSFIPALRNIFNENILFVNLIIFFFVPMFYPMFYYSPGLYLTNYMTVITEDIAYDSLRDIGEQTRNIIGPGLFVIAIGLFLLLVTLFMVTLGFFWRFSEGREDLDLYDEDEFIGNFHVKNSVKLLLGVLASIAGLGVALGMILPYMGVKYREGFEPTSELRYPSFLLPDERTYVDFEWAFRIYVDFSAMVYTLIGLFVLIAGIVLILSSLNVIKKPITLGPLIFFSITLLFLPIYRVETVFPDIWYPTSIQIISYLTAIKHAANQDNLDFDLGNINSRIVLKPSGGYFYFSIILLFFILLLSIGLFSFKKIQTIAPPPEVEYETPESVTTTPADDTVEELITTRTEPIKKPPPKKVAKPTPKAKRKKEKEVKKEMTEKEKALAELLESIDATEIIDDD